MPAKAETVVCNACDAEYVLPACPDPCPECGAAAGYRKPGTEKPKPVKRPR